MNWKRLELYKTFKNVERNLKYDKNVTKMFQKCKKSVFVEELVI